MGKAEDEKILKAMADDALTSKFATEIGQKVLVERHAIANERMNELRAVIFDVGEDIGATTQALKGMPHLASLSIHIYAAEAMRTAMFVDLNAYGNTPYELCDGALRELNRAVRMHFGKAEQKLRSGF